MKKMLGKKRRAAILKWLKETDEPLPGSEIARRTNVSRQVIVQDVSLLKAAGEKVQATPQGYILKVNDSIKKIRVIAVRHTKEQAEQELNLLVDHGVTVIDVIVEHPLYGELVGQLQLNNRFDVEKFIRKLSTTNAIMLSGLTDGVHLHTIEADTDEQLDAAILALDKAGLLFR